jgi:hypothetical protein
MLLDHRLYASLKACSAIVDRAEKRDGLGALRDEPPTGIPPLMSGMPLSRNLECWYCEQYTSAIHGSAGMLE